MSQWFGKTKIDEASDAWREFKDIKRANEENIDKFLLRYETAESKLKNTAVDMHKLILAIQLMEAANVTLDQRRNILAHVKIDNHDNVYDDMKSALRLMKGTLVEGVKELPSDEEVNFSRNYGVNRSRSKSKPEFESRSFDRNGRQRSQSNGRSKERGRSRENRRGNGYRESSHGRNREYSRDERINYIKTECIETSYFCYEYIYFVLYDEP